MRRLQRRAGGARCAAWVLLACALGLSSCAGVAPQAGDAPVRLTVLHTNDHHGRYWRRGDGSAGLAARKTVVDQVRREVAASGGHTLLLDGGDVNTGVPESDLQDAEPDFVGMSALGYDAMAVGNHEFDKPEAVQRVQRTSWSRFPWLSANVYKDGARLFEPYRIFQFGRLKVAVLGLTTEDTGRMLSPRKHPGVGFTLPADEARRLVPELRRQADVVVAATHLGHYVDGRHGVSAPGDVELARSVAGIDLIVGGHTHTPLCMLAENLRNDRYEPRGPCAPDRQNGAWIVQAGEWGKFIGRADFEWRAGRFTLLKYTLIPVNLRPDGPAVAEDPAVLGLLAPYQQRAAAGLQTPVGSADARFDGDRASVRHRPTALGTLITRAMAEKAQADFAVVSGGGIRDSLPAGPWRLRDLLQALPFGNQLVVVEMSGAEVFDYVGAMAKMTPGSGAYPQSWNLRYGLDSGGALREVWVKGAPLDRAGRYRLATSSFVASGGDGYPDLSRHPGLTNTGWVDVDVLREFIARHSPLQAREFEPDAR
jgi:5'-nucleotidase / UDP-sugar diphosphatase